MIFSILSFSMQEEINLTAYLHPLAIKPHFNEKMNIWTLHLVSFLTAVHFVHSDWNSFNDSSQDPPLLFSFSIEGKMKYVSKDRTALFWVLAFSWDYANKQKKNTHFHLYPLRTKALFQEYQLFLPTCFFKLAFSLFPFYLSFLASFIMQ